jgi:hypothetical protein
VSPVKWLRLVLGWLFVAIALVLWIIVVPLAEAILDGLRWLSRAVLPGRRRVETLFQEESGPLEETSTPADRREIA